MISLNKILCAAAALTIVFSVSGCGKKDEISSASDSSAKDSSVSDSAVSKAESAVDTSNIGEHLKKAAKIYEGGKYTLKCTISSTSYDGEIKLTRVVDGDNIYQLQEEKAGSYGVISVDGKSYDFDNSCGMYKTAKSVPTNNVVQEVINQNLPAKQPNAAEKEKGYVCEEYTFTGDTYITNIRFYFDEKTDELKKYTMKYTVEGQDDITETRVIDSVSSDVDESVFKLDFLKKMVNFEEMSEEQRLGFCQGVCSSKGITKDMMSELGIKVDDFNKIDFDTFFNLVYTYSGKN